MIISTPVTHIGKIDCDIHPAFTGTKDLLPYLNDYWREQVTIRGIDGLDLTSYDPKVAAWSRPAWKGDDPKAGLSLAKLQNDVLDKFNVSLAICNCLYGAQITMSEDLSAALCSAINDWMTEHWLDRDPRLRASIVVPMNSPSLAVKEIERRASDKRFVQVLFLAVGELLLGKRSFWPVYEAAERNRLAIGIHAGNQYRIPPIGGWPSYRLEYYLAESEIMQSQLQSMVFEGVFSKFPDLKVVLMESGVTWIPPFFWRMDKIWKGMRVEVPWVTQPPSELFRRSLAFTTQPFDGPCDVASVDKIVKQIDGSQMFLFATDYPHWQFDGDDPVPEGFSPSLVQQMIWENAFRVYPRLAEPN